MMKSLTNLRYRIFAGLTLLACSVIFFSCEKMAGHTIGTTTTVVKSGIINFSVKDTLHTLTTTFDTVNFSTVTSPSVLTTIYGSNLSSPLQMKLTVSALTAGSYKMSTFSAVYTQSTGNNIKTSNTNSGTVTFTTLNVSSGLAIGSFTTTIQVGSHAADTAIVTGNFSIQQ